MALPKLNDKPLYTLTVPSTGKKVKFRPFLVKEEKVLLLALESKDSQQIFDAMNNTIAACIPDLDTDTLASFDVEYIFTQLRTKSVGESASVKIACAIERCGEDNEINIPLSEIQVKGLEGKANNVVTINDDIKVEMKWPNFNELTDKELLDAADTDKVLGLIRKCMVAILTDEERILVKNESVQEINDFLESMNQGQFRRIQEFVENMPRLEHDITFNCVKCGAINNHKLQGMNDFF